MSCLLLQEEEQKRLELEMQKRRERIERWRAEKKKMEIETTKKDGKSMLANLQLPAAKKWSLEDDSDEEAPIIANKDTKEVEEEPVVEEEPEEKKEEVKMEEEDEIDPLDAYMAGVQEEVRKVNKADNKAVKPGKVASMNFNQTHISKSLIICIIFSDYYSRNSCDWWCSYCHGCGKEKDSKAERRTDRTKSRWFRIFE